MSVCVPIVVVLGLLLVVVGVLLVLLVVLLEAGPAALAPP